MVGKGGLDPPSSWMLTKRSLLSYFPAATAKIGRRADARLFYARYQFFLF